MAYTPFDSVDPLDCSDYFKHGESPYALYIFYILIILKMNMKEKLKGFIIENFLSGKGELKDDQLLFEEGIIDSFGFVVLLTFLEKEFNIRFDRSAIMIDNFSTLNNIAEAINNASRAAV